MDNRYPSILVNRDSHRRVPFLYLSWLFSLLKVICTHQPRRREDHETELLRIPRKHGSRDSEREWLQTRRPSSGRHFSHDSEENAEGTWRRRMDGALWARRRMLRGNPDYAIRQQQPIQIQPTPINLLNALVRFQTCRLRQRKRAGAFFSPRNCHQKSNRSTHWSPRIRIGSCWKQ